MGKSVNRPGNQSLGNYSFFLSSPLTNSKIVLPMIREGLKEGTSHVCEWENGLGKCAPMSRNSIVVSSNRDLPTDSKLVSFRAS
jgi:hypothetical protein